MKIEYCKAEIKKISDIKIGECLAKSNEIYIKIFDSDYPRNAFSLSSNKVATFNHDSLVTPVNAKVVLE